MIVPKIVEISYRYCCHVKLSRFALYRIHSLQSINRTLWVKQRCDCLRWYNI